MNAPLVEQLVRRYKALTSTRPWGRIRQSVGGVVCVCRGWFVCSAASAFGLTAVPHAAHQVRSLRSDVDECRQTALQFQADMAGLLTAMDRPLTHRLLRLQQARDTAVRQSLTMHDLYKAVP